MAGVDESAFERTIRIISPPHPFTPEVLINESLMTAANFNMIDVLEQTTRKFQECIDSEVPISWSPYSLMSVDGAPIDIQSIMMDKNVHREFHHIIEQVFNTFIETSPLFSNLKNDSLYFFQQDARYTDLHGDVVNDASYIHLHTNPDALRLKRSTNPAYRQSDYRNINDFKIHLCVKPEYSFWVAVRLALFTNDHFGEPHTIKRWKFFLNPRETNILQTDTFMIASMGGNLPAFVLYGTENVSGNRTALKGIIRHFEPYESLIGNVELSQAGAIKLPAGNLRYNSLVAYASGDRTSKMAMLTQLRSGNLAAIPPQYGASDWIQRLCARNDRETIFRYFLDEDYCVPKYGNPPKKDWSELRSYPLPDPRTLMAEDAEFRYRRMIPTPLRASVRSYFPALSEHFFGLRDPRRVNENVAAIRAQTRTSRRKNRRETYRRRKRN